MNLKSDVRLPLEIWHEICFYHVPDRSTLSSMARVCRALQVEAETILYRDVYLLHLPSIPIARIIRQIKAITRLEHRVQSIRNLCLTLGVKLRFNPTFLRLVRGVLGKAKNLSSLSLDVRPWAPIRELDKLGLLRHGRFRPYQFVLASCKAKLRSFTGYGGHMTEEPYLLEFLRSQPEIRMLCLPMEDDDGSSILTAFSEHTFLPHLTIFTHDLKSISPFPSEISRPLTCLDLPRRVDPSIDTLPRALVDTLPCLRVLRITTELVPALPKLLPLRSTLEAIFTYEYWPKLNSADFMVRERYISYLD